VEGNLDSEDMGTNPHRSFGFSWWDVSGAMAGVEPVPQHFRAGSLPIVDRMNRNMESVMTILTPVALLSVAPVLFFSYSDGFLSCWQPSEQAWRCSDRAARGNAAASGCYAESA
jgi:hypothetical protein